MAQYLRLQNLPTEADNEDIRHFFHQFEIPEAGVHIIGGKDEEAFIAFHGEKQLLKALYSLDRQQLLGKEVKLLLGYESDMETIVRNRIKEIEEARTTVSCADIEHKQEETTPLWLKDGKHTDSPTPQKRESNSTEIEPTWSKRPRHTSSHNPSHKKGKDLSSKSRNCVRKTHGGDDKPNVPSRPSWHESSGHKQVKKESSAGTCSQATTVRENEVSNLETSVAITKDRNCPIKKEKIEEVPDTNAVQEDSKIERQAHLREEQRYSRGHLEERKTWKERRGIRASTNDSVQSDRPFFSDYLSWFPFSGGGGKTYFYLRVFDLHSDVTASEVWSWFDGAYGVVLVRSPKGTLRPSQAIVVFKDFATGRSAMNLLLGTKVQSCGWHPQKVLSYLSDLTQQFQISVTTNCGTDHILSSKQRRHFFKNSYSVGSQTLSAKFAAKSRKYLIQTSQETRVVKTVKHQTLSDKNSKGLAGAQKFKMTPKKKQNKLPQSDKPK